MRRRWMPSQRPEIAISRAAKLSQMTTCRQTFGAARSGVM